ncbi:MAG: hypothetical protein HKM04_01190 [Legionellales bacterium]|nr:hypothetical protein [Legionellales bacterium]
MFYFLWPVKATPKHKLKVKLLTQGHTLEDVSKETGLDIETLKELSPVVVH